VSTVATAGAGIEELMEALLAHRAALGELGEENRRANRRERDFRRAVHAGLEWVLAPLVDGPVGAELQADVGAGVRDPWSAAATLIERARIAPAADD
jgi:putative protein kinase ArgK-like GTPase of G3E family